MTENYQQKEFTYQNSEGNSFIQLAKALGEEEAESILRLEFMKLLELAHAFGTLNYTSASPEDVFVKVSKNFYREKYIIPFVDQADSFSAKITKIIDAFKKRNSIVLPYVMDLDLQVSTSPLFGLSKLDDYIKSKLVKDIKHVQLEESKGVSAVITYESGNKRILTEEQWKEYERVYHTKKGQIDLGYGTNPNEIPKIEVAPHEELERHRETFVLFNERPYGAEDFSGFNENNNRTYLFAPQRDYGINYFLSFEPVNVLFMELVDLSLLRKITSNANFVADYRLETNQWCAVEFATYMRKIQYYQQRNIPGPGNAYARRNEKVSTLAIMFTNTAFTLNNAMNVDLWENLEDEEWENLVFNTAFGKNIYKSIGVYLNINEPPSPNPGNWNEFVNSILEFAFTNERDAISLLGVELPHIQLKGQIAENRAILMETKHNTFYEKTREFFRFFSEPFANFRLEKNLEYDLENYEDTPDTRTSDMRRVKSEVKSVQIQKDGDVTIFYKDGSFKKLSYMSYEMKSRKDLADYKIEKAELQISRKAFKHMMEKEEYVRMQLEAYMEKMRKIDEEKMKSETEESREDEERKQLMKEYDMRRKRWNKELEEEEKRVLKELEEEPSNENNEYEARKKKKRLERLISSISDPNSRLVESDIHKFLDTISVFILDNVPLKSECIPKIKQFRDWKNTKTKQSTSEWISKGKESIGAAIYLLSSIQRDSTDVFTKDTCKGLTNGIKNVLIKSSVNSSS
jgi:hypothetical protein